MNQYFEEGIQAFRKTLKIVADENPYKFTSKEFEKRKQWDEGFTSERNKYFNEKYKIQELRNKILELVQSYGLKMVRDGDYDCYIVFETPEGFTTDIIEEDED